MRADISTEPFRLTPRRLVEMIGDDPAALLMRKYAGRRIPRLPRHYDRDARICARLQRDDAPEQIAHDYKLTVRHVLRIEKKCLGHDRPH